MEAVKRENASLRMSVIEALVPGACLSLDELEQHVGENRRSLGRTVGRLVIAGLVERDDRDCFVLTEKGRTTQASRCAAPQPQSRMHIGTSMRQGAWNVMRMGHSFTLDNLMTSCGAVDASNLRTYLRALLQAGYLMQLPVTANADRRGPKPRRYRLLDNTGPRAPTARRGNKEVYDYNIREARPCVTL